ncbi:hypothetical protein I7X12_05175 [Halosimplex litoreum]|uniref:Uncharacterized protein n=1 Tax=Halosimplex litoreum TaxID=1198301 RepID=A0A7T3G0E0_9EURY|nr:hypothetical protein [Halosimplex litoreum]QPV64023.1 hypothetical protein I7X12_05175 [Halosimplex litoreum]
MDLPPGVYTENVHTDDVGIAYRNRLDEISYVVDAEVRNSSASHLTTRTENDSWATHMHFGRDTGTPITVYRTDEGLGFLAHSGSGATVTIYGTGPTGARMLGESVVDRPRRVVSSYIDAAEWEPLGVRETDGGKRVVLSAASVGDETAHWEIETIRSIDGSIDVNGQGLITNGSFTFTVEQDGETETRTFTVETERRSDGFVTEPSWLSESSRAEASAEAADKLLAVDLTDGPALDPGTTLHVNTSDELQNLGSVTFDERVGPGQTFYVYRTADNGTTTYHTAVGKRPTLPENATAFTQSVFVSARVGDTGFEAGVEISGDSETEAAAEVAPPDRTGAADLPDRSPTESDGRILLGLAALAPVGLAARRLDRD